ncbi:MAG: hypothetical protein AABY16_02095 [Nanoarchaeota archaeon]
MRLTFNRPFFVLVSLLLASLLFANVVSAQSNFFKDIADQWQSGDLNDNTVRVLFAFIVLMFVMTLVDRLPGLSGENKGWLRWIMGVVITLLATAYLKVEEIKTTLFAYSALGFVLGAAVPFLLLMFFSYDLLNVRKSGISQKWVAKLFVYALWIAFAGFMLYRIVSISGASTAVPDFLKYAHYALFILAVFVLLFMRAFVRKITSAQFEATREGMKTTFEEARIAEEAERTEIDETEALARKRLKLRK